ncbi:mycofactocin-coupled SDR family oxidoreductase [Nocardioides sp. CER19]|uniref:mycofactocin-coupled SDR family oxidoreductase n=1 Tax=Nocardioides sp. CER19 TaxID=3038538 RepID=UPI00244C48FC|nr:mycofactocin-coupled SDR family oxidoreductase [Nocardioides sp. CER19]MDH2416141.1 mycofactocin-coupled SDR family oxidoreductase [Nocardioides sp. CER19]
MRETKVVRVALVTGAARGIGAATARRLAADGYSVLALDWCAGPSAYPYPMPERSDLDAVVGPLSGAVAHVADVRDRQGMDAAVELAHDRWGRLDVAVACAGVITGGRTLWDTPDQELEFEWGVNAKGVWNTAAAAIPAMLAGPDPSGCRFVAVTSAAGSRGLFHLAGYNAAKHAAVGIVRGLAADLTGTGVTAVAVSPGSTRTQMLDATVALYPGATTEDLSDHQLLQRALSPDEVAAAVAFCCSIEGASLNGSVLHADGGFRG